MDWKEKLGEFADPDKADLIAERSAKVAARRAALDQEDRATIHAMIARKYARCVGQQYAACRLDNFVDRPGSNEVTNACRRHYARKPIPPMLWLGEVGTGKDHLMTAMLHGQWSTGATVRRDDGSDFAGLIRDQINSPQSEEDFLRQFTDPDIWAISDPDGVRSGITDHHSEWLLRIVDKRYREGKPTWATINVTTSAEAYKRLGLRTWDRMIDKAIVMLCRWPSFRKPAEAVIGKGE